MDELVLGGTGAVNVKSPLLLDVLDRCKQLLPEGALGQSCACEAVKRGLSSLPSNCKVMSSDIQKRLGIDLARIAVDTEGEE
jgi:hypothetical protein